MVLPSVLPTGRVVWQIVVGVVDGPDQDDRPDLIGARGTVAFTASIPSTVNPVAAPNAYSVALTTKVGVLDEEGYLCTPDPADPSKPGVRGMFLFATDNAELSNKDWTWTATPRLKDVNGQRLDNVIKPFSFAVPSMDDETAHETPLDLAAFVPIPASQGLGKEQIAALAATATAAATSSEAAAIRAREESEHATRIALRVAERADAGEFNGRDGETIAPETVAGYMGEEGNPVREAISATVNGAVTPLRAGITSSPTITVRQMIEVGTGATRITAVEAGRSFLILRANDADIQVASGWPDSTSDPGTGYETVTAGTEVLIQNDAPVWAKASTATTAILYKEVRP